MTIIQEFLSVPPDINRLRNQGWVIVSTIGPYCTAWKDFKDVLFIWKNDAWQRVH